MEKVTTIEMQPPDKKNRKNIPKEVVIHEDKGSRELAAELIFKYIQILMDPS